MRLHKLHFLKLTPAESTCLPHRNSDSCTVWEPYSILSTLFSTTGASAEGTDYNVNISTPGRAEEESECVESGDRKDCVGEGSSNKGMALPSNPLSEWQFHCTVCQDVFTDPVSTHCGHSFCKACLSGFWDGSDMWQCPLCKKRFAGPLDLSVNTVLAQITQDFKRRRLEAPKLEDKCEEEESCPSLCDDEAQSCCTDDLLVEPSVDHKDSMCEKHDQPLELFCRTDRMCVCTLCVEEDHGAHTTVPIEREWSHSHAQLRTQVLQVKQEILERQKKMEEIKWQMKLSREDAEKELKEGLQVLSDILRSVEKCQAELEEVIEGKQREAESRAQSLLEELEQEIRDLKSRKAELKQLLGCQDHARVLQSFPSQPTPLHSKDWANIIVPDSLCVGTVRSVLSPYEDNFREKLRELMDAEFKKIRQYADDVTLDPLTAHRNLVVSEDRKEVRYETWTQVPDNPERFDSVHNVLGKETFTSGRHYWEVQVEGNTCWYLGVVTASINKKGSISSKPKNGLWLLRRQDEVIFRALDDLSVELSLSSGRKKVGVFVDYEEGQISFYDVEARSPIYSFTGNTFTEELCLLLNTQTSHKVPMILSPISQTE